MTEERARRIRELFDHAASLAGDERDRLLARECGGDESLRREVESLLARSPATGDLPVRPLIPAAGDAAPPPGSIAVDGYRVLRLVGAGGMGVVYEAEQESPRRRVAIKVLRGGGFADEVRRRLFLREVDTLARLVHPGIARIYESGRTRDGQLFFSMEMVDGTPLDEHVRSVHDAGLDRRRTRRELDLFRRICDAVHFAHRRGVIHRDLKPSNILLVEEGGTGASRDGTKLVPKILDFGLARITDPDAELSFVTEVGAIRGTLQYMSPEQARGVPQEIDVRSDVYSLGVVLYGMLTGAQPYSVSGVDVPEALRRILEEEPVPLRRAGSGATAADAELEAIAGKALEKNADRRYQSAHALGEDVSRYLEGRPVEARPPSTMYQARKFVSRHRVGFAVGVSLFAALLVAVAGTTAGMLRARRAESVARTEARTAQATVDLLAEILEGADPLATKGNQSLRDVLDAGAERVRDGLEDQPAVRARLQGVLGKTYVNLGLVSEGRPLLDEAVAALDSLGRAETPEMVEALNHLGSACVRVRDYPGAAAALERALAIGERVLTGDDERTAYTLYLLGYVAITEGDLEEAREKLRRSLAIRERVHGPAHHHVASSVVTLAQSFQAGGEYDSASALYERALGIYEESGEGSSGAMAVALNNLGALRYGMGDLDGCRECFERAAEIQESALGPEHPDLARTLSNLGAITIESDPEAATPLLERAVAIREKVFGPDNLEVAVSLGYFAMARDGTGHPAAARADLERAGAIIEATRGPEHPEMARNLELRAGILRQLGETAAAETAEARAKAIREAAGAAQ